MAAELHTARTELRPIAPEDAEELHALFTDGDVRRYLLDGEVMPLEWVHAEIERSMRSFETDRHGIWAIRRPGSPSIIGFAGFRPFFDPPQLQLLYGLLPRWWGQGYALEASRAVVDHAFDELEFEEVLAATDTPNTASIAVLERLGMARDGEPEDGPHGTLFFALRRALTALVLGSLAACGGAGGNDDAGSGRAGDPGGTEAGTAAAASATANDTVAVFLTEYTIDIPVRLEAGETTFLVSNQGVEDHNLRILPAGTDDILWQTEGNVGAGRSQVGTVDLAPGEYMVVCDFAGHDTRGMFVEIVVGEDGR